MATLEWPPTAYGQMMFQYIVELHKRGEIDKETAGELLDGWFKQPPQV